MTPGPVRSEPASDAGVLIRYYTRKIAKYG
jgi:hypothetical protein